jgi:MFS family permease
MARNTSTKPGSRSDSLWTIAAIGLIAYAGETLGHELIGHGGVCALSGGQVTALAPLWMRCSVQSLPMVAAGPLFNFIAAAAFAALLRWRRRIDAWSYFFWLSASFNLLVACGYMLVGGLTTWGDWGVVFTDIQPSWAWRAPLALAGLIGYAAGLRLLGGLYARFAGHAGFEPGVLQRRTLLPGAAAAIMACAAEIVGGRMSVATIGLTLGCTLFVGWSLRFITAPKSPAGGGDFAVRGGFGLMLAAAIVAGVFVGIVGPAAKFS